MTSRQSRPPRPSRAGTRDTRLKTPPFAWVRARRRTPLTLLEWTSSERVVRRAVDDCIREASGRVPVLNRRCRASSDPSVKAATTTATARRGKAGAAVLHSALRRALAGGDKVRGVRARREPAAAPSIRLPVLVCSSGARVVQLI